tara:strand:+ start:108 stop:326 length:219 start_codon:yes stop_codon:yes gene_type:complete
MRFLLFKFFLRITSYFSVDEKWLSKQIHIEKQLKICKDRQKEMDACVRPRSYPKVRGEAHYTDYFDEDNWQK